MNPIRRFAFHRRALPLALTALLLASAAQAQLSEREKNIHLLNRTTYGARPQDLAEVERLGRAAWVDRQMAPATIRDEAVAARLQQRSGLEGFSSTNPLVASGRRQAQMAGAKLSEQLAIASGNMRSARDMIEDGTRRLDSARARLSSITDATSPEYAELKGEMDVSMQQLSLAQQQATLAESTISEARRTYEAVVGRALLTSRLMEGRLATFLRPPEVGVLVTTKLERAVYSERQLEEVMTDFWFNHFNVFYAKSVQVGWTLSDYEQKAIRAHVFGKFEDMLAATAQHAAMMLYLDNATSRAAPPIANGINENYARELMELHTLGVDAGYTQQDVIEVAKAFTGWGTNGNNDQLVDFQYRPEYHEPGAKTVLGRVVPERIGERGMDEGLEILGMLARHPATAQHIATKLVRHFVSDDPPAALVAEVARVFTQTNGDLKAVTRALFLSDRFYARENFRVKVKRPFEFMASALRASGAELEVKVNDESLVTRLGIMQHLPYWQPAPTGFSNVSIDWVSASAALDRVNFSLALVTGGYDEVTLDLENGLADAPPFFNVVGFLDPMAVSQLLEGILLAQPSSDLHRAVMQRISEPMNRGRPQALANAVALAIGSPDFQRY